MCGMHWFHTWFHCVCFPPVTITAMLKHESHGNATDGFNVHWYTQYWTAWLCVNNEDCFLAPDTRSDVVNAFVNR